MAKNYVRQTTIHTNIIKAAKQYGGSLVEDTAGVVVGGNVFYPSVRKAANWMSCTTQQLVSGADCCVIAMQSPCDMPRNQVFKQSFGLHKSGSLSEHSLNSLLYIYSPSSSNIQPLFSRHDTFPLSLLVTQLYIYIPLQCSAFMKKLIELSKNGFKKGGEGVSAERLASFPLLHFAKCCLSSASLNLCPMCWICSSH